MEMCVVKTPLGVIVFSLNLSLSVLHIKYKDTVIMELHVAPVIWGMVTYTTPKAL